ncbi:ThiS family protein [Chloroflexota bacterium]
MSIKINLAQFFHQYTNGQEVVEVKGSTVGQCVAHLVKQFPNIEQGLFSNDGKLHGYIDIFVNGENSYPEGLAKPVKPSGELYILFILDGG